MSPSPLDQIYSPIKGPLLKLNVDIFKTKFFNLQNIRPGGPFLLTDFNTFVPADAGIVPTVFKHIQDLGTVRDQCAPTYAAECFKGSG